MKIRSAVTTSIVTCALVLSSAILTTNGVQLQSASASETSIAQKVAVPAYINPLADPEAWARMASAESSSIGFAVANVINGPDYTPLPEWQTVMQTVSANGVGLVGYVDTGYLGTTGQRTRLGSTDALDWMSQIQHDIAAWYQFYGTSLSGIFFDQAQNACGPTADSNDWANLYRQLSHDVDRLHPGALTVLNPGVGVPQCYEDTADVIVTFEGSYDMYLGKDGVANPYTPLSWTPVDPTKIWHIVYGAPDAATMSQVMELSKSRSAGYVYVTDDVLANPYDTLPPADYWTAELGAAAEAPSSVRPPSRPTWLDTVEVFGTSVILDWEASRSRSAPVVAYDIFRDGTKIDSVPGDVVTYTAVDLTPLTTYTFSVVARDALGSTSAESAAIVVSTDETYGDPRRPPTNFTATDTTFTSAHLVWQPAAEHARRNRPDIADYVVQQNGHDIMRLPGWVTGVTVGGLAPDSTYSFTVYSIDQSGDRTDYSAQLAVTTPALPGGATIGTTVVTPTVDQFSFSADYFVPFAFRRVFIATGNTANPCWATGSDPQTCSDFLVENDRLLRYTGTGTNWDWSIVADVVPTVIGTNYTWAVSAADLGAPATITAVFNANGYGPNSYCGVGFACTVTGPPLPYE